LFVTPNQALACRRARLRRRSFLRRHFHRWFPVFFQAREPRFIVNRSPTDHSYMSASGYTALNSHHNLAKIASTFTISNCHWKRAYQDSTWVVNYEGKRELNNKNHYNRSRNNWKFCNHR
jgi:hypothetical protein